MVCPHALGWGQAPALHFWNPALYRGTGHAFDRRNEDSGGKWGIARACAPRIRRPAGRASSAGDKTQPYIGVARLYRNLSRIGVRDMLSYQWLMPAAAGTRRYQNWGHWLVEGSGVVCATHPTPTPAGDKPPRYIFSFRHRPSVYNSARFARGEPASRLIGGHIPDRSPGLAFVPIAHAGGRRHTKVRKLGAPPPSPGFRPRIRVPGPSSIAGTTRSGNNGELPVGAWRGSPAG